MQQSIETIAAIATAQGRGGVGIIRVSGSKSRFIAQQLFGKVPKPRYAYYSDFNDEDGVLIDAGIALFFENPHSYTGEDVLELQGHGGVAVLQLLLQRCLSLGAKLAEPGEFTKRAYLNNKLDLAQAEAVVDLIEAKTTQAARSAMRSLNGDFSASINNLVNDLVELRMLVESMLDFPEEDIDELDTHKKRSKLEKISINLTNTLQAAKQGSLLREGAHIALIGQPNVGKSSLLNCLSGEIVALVSNIPGTTRDVIRKEIQINGIPLHIIDTAGLRESEDEIEKMGIALTYETSKKADLILLLRDINTIDDIDNKILKSFPSATPILQVLNKLDLCQPHKLRTNSYPSNSIAVSAKTGEGIPQLRDKLLELVGWNSIEGGTFMSRQRHLLALQEAYLHICQAKKLDNQPEFFAEELRLAQFSLSSITGKFTADDLLGEIFSRFCIGK